ncbi:MAG: hypothetical protein AAF941_09780 [Pseudomonadota bacterium]
MTGTKLSRERLRRVGIALLLLALALVGFAILGAERRVESQVFPTTDVNASTQTRGAAAFVGAGFGGISLEALETNAIPWKLTAAALVLDEQTRNPNAHSDLAVLRKILTRFGFLYPERIEGISGELDLTLGAKPLGMTHGDIAPIGGAKVEIANLGCASCHSGVGYDANGDPDPTLAFPGMPNTSLDLESYTQAIFVALREHGDNPALLETVDALFPEISWRERLSLQWIVLPLARQRLADLEGQESPLPFPNGLPGATNGVAALKQQFGTPLLGGGPQDRGFVSIPELALRDRRSRLLADGAYAVPSGAADPRALAAITSFFTVPSMGVHPHEARSHQAEAEAIFAWLAKYRPQPFPQPVSKEEARDGLRVYQGECASCHGRFEWTGEQPALADFPDWIGDVGTDPLRAQTFDRALAEAIGGTSYAELIDVRIGDGYAAPPLAGLWASAPYLHNGSIHSLEALLDPDRRLSRFKVGGHALDLESIGVRVENDGQYPAGYTAFSTPQWVDTSEPGMGNVGHEYGSELSKTDRRALIEFLKLL